MAKSLAEMQRAVDDYVQQFKVGYFSPLAQMARLTEETGELAREINHYYGEKPKKATEGEKLVSEELADVLFVTLAMANSLDIDLTATLEKTLSKFHTRDAERFERRTDAGAAADGVDTMPDAGESAAPGK